MKNIMTKIYGIAMIVYGGFVAACSGYMFIADEVWASTRLELVMLITGIPALFHGIKTLKKIWIAEAISEKDKEIEEIKQSMQLTIVDSAAA